MDNYMRKSGPFENATPTHWNLTGRSTIAPSPVLSRSSIPPPPSYCAFVLKIQKKSAPFFFKKKKDSSFQCLFFLPLEKCVSLKLRISKLCYARDCPYCLSYCAVLVTPPSVTKSKSLRYRMISEQ